MQRLILFIGLFLCLQVSAQLPEDALRSSWTTPSGTAREQAIGGAMGSLGGDISAAFVNPAGLGFYRTSEAVISPGWRFLMDKSNYLNSTINGASAHNFNLGTSGFVFSFPSQAPGVSNAFAIAVNRTADFNKNVHYGGLNGNSSFAEQWAEEFAASGMTIDNGIFTPGLSYGARMALYTSLVDTATVNGTLQVIAQPQKAGRVIQDNNLQSSGGITEIDLSLATNQHDKWYFGGSLGIPILNYTRNQTYTETDATGNPNNDFESFTYRETYTTKGYGINGKLGVIFRPTVALRFGLAITTPSLLGLTDNIHASMVTKTENYTSLKQVSISSDSLDYISNIDPPLNSVDYNLRTPWKFLVSGSYLFGGGAANVKQQKGFITADLEYITTGSPHFGAPANDDGSSGDNSYFDQVNQAIRSNYKGSLGARLGGEMKFNILMVRAGAAYYSSPYQDGGLKADRLFFSGGLGYRNKGLFVDLTYVMGFSRDIDVPYRLADKTNSYASLKETGGTLLMTVGIKL
ncbi:MAG TPA: aromatic hydrocarbon degradation protein [Puia sp.]